MLIIFNILDNCVIIIRITRYVIRKKEQNN